MVLAQCPCASGSGLLAPLILLLGMLAFSWCMAFLRPRKCCSSSSSENNKPGGQTRNMGTVALLVLIAVIAAATFVSMKRAASSSDAQSTPAVVVTGLPRLVDLGSKTCIPCKMMAPILEELKTEYAGTLDVEFIDVKDDPAAGARYRMRLIPTQIFIDVTGQELFRHEGFMPKEDILAKWKELGFDLTPASRTGENANGT